MRIFLANSISETIEFSGLLKAIRQAYMNAVRERKESKYRKPTFMQERQ